jgi:hypothetical protein
MNAQRVRLSALVFGLLLTASVAAPATADPGQHFRGRLVSYHAEDATMTRTVVAGYALESGSRHYQLSFRDTSLARYVGRDVELTGSRRGRSIDVASYRVLADGSASTIGGSTVAAAAVQKNVAVILLNFLDDTSEPYTPDFVAGVYFNNANSDAHYFAEQSYDQLAMTGQVFGWYTIDYNNVGCDWAAWGDAAKAKAESLGADFSTFTNLAYVFPWAPDCGWLGLAYLSGSRTYINKSVTLRTTSHELSHNFGVHHASTYNCVRSGVRVSLSAVSTDCTLSEYGDPFSVLGSAQTRQSHAWHKTQMGYLGNTGDRRDVSAAGNYALGPQEVSSSTPKIIRVARAGDSGRYFYLEFRQPYGSYFDNFTASDPAVNGVFVRLGPDYSTKTQSLLLDATPETSSWTDSALPVGRTLTDPLSKVSFTTQSVSATGAVVNIAFNVDVTPPSAPGGLTPTTGPNSVTLGWAASTDNVGVVGYRVFRGNTFLGATSARTWTDTGLTTGTTYDYAVMAYDARENVSSKALVSATPGQTDTQPPSAPANLMGSVNKGGVTTLTWTAAQDNVAVSGYRVYRNGSLFGTTSATSYSGKKARGTWTWYVVAFDPAGNTSLPSNSVTVTVR